MISKEKIQSVIEIIKKVTKTNDVYLFGSYAQGKAKENSDLDIAIIKDDITEQRKEDFMIRKMMISEGYVPMDLVFLDRINYEKRKNYFGNIYHEVFKNGINL